MPEPSDQKQRQQRKENKKEERPSNIQRFKESLEGVDLKNSEQLATIAAEALLSKKEIEARTTRVLREQIERLGPKPFGEIVCGVLSDIAKGVSIKSPMGILVHRCNELNRGDRPE